MKLQAFLLCRDVQTGPDGLLNILGVGLDTVSVKQSSKELARAKIIIRFHKETIEIGKRFMVIKVVDSNGKIIGSPIETTIVLSPKSAGSETIVNFASNLLPGNHKIDLFLDNKLISSYPLKVVWRQHTKTM